jgi:hypothetical protein
MSFQLVRSNSLLWICIISRSEMRIVGLVMVLKKSPRSLGLVEETRREPCYELGRGNVIPAGSLSGDLEG